MRQSFTRAFIEDNCGCYSAEDLNKCSFMAGTITLEAIVNSEIPLKDKYWFVCKKAASKDENKQIAIAVAEIVLPIYENRHPGDMRPREAIEAVKAYISGHITIEQLRKKRDAAYAAAAAAYAAAADAAAYVKQQLLDYLKQIIIKQPQ